MAYSKVGAYQHIWPPGWVLARGGRLFEVGRLFEKQANWQPV